MPRNNRIQPRRIAVAVSGGVDSSVAAALLQRQGHDVQGIFMKNFSPESWTGVAAAACPWEQDQRDAESVCNTLGIPFRSVNFEREYEQDVIRYFFREYRAGRTPNPDIRCNRLIKFGVFLRYAAQLGCDLMATGHYARVRAGRLYAGADRRKDQSYFLYQLSERVLRRTLFPLAGYTKRQVRAMASRWRLPTADKDDSQGICFVGRVDLQQFLSQRITPRRGAVRSTDGRQIGEHRGVWYYTIGQRHGLGIGGGTPLYVAAKNVRTNVLTVAASRNHPALRSRRIHLKQLHWINHRPRRWPIHCYVKIRSQQPAQRCVAEHTAAGVILAFRRPQFAAASGQAAVIYTGTGHRRVLGGGTIV